MRNRTGIIVLAVIVAALCLYYLSFSFISRSVQNKAEAYATDAQGNVNHAKKQAYLDSVWTEPVFMGMSYQDVKENELSLGLDLKGGMHVVLEISPVEIIKSLSGNSKNPAFQQALARAQEMQKNSQEGFVDLFAQAYREIEPNGKLSHIFSNTTTRGRISYDSSNDEVISVINAEVEDAISRSFNILRTRIDKFGVTQPNIQRLKGSGRIQVELPGVDNPDRVRNLLQGMANLEFWEVWSVEEFAPYFNQLNDYLVKQEKNQQVNLPEAVTNNDTDLADALNAANDSATVQATASADTGSLANQLEGEIAQADTAAATDSLAQNQSALLARLFVPMQNGLGANVRDTAKVNALFARPDVRAIFPQNMKFLWAVKPIEGNNNQQFLELYAIKRGRDGKAPVAGDVVSNAYQDFDQRGRPEIYMQMTSTGARKWQRLTANNIGKQVAIVLDDNVYSAPVVQNEIAGGNSSISGNFTIEEAQDLANILKAGKMPAPTRIVEEAIVGPSLGQEAINQGLISTIAGLVIVMLFMIAYYSKGGIVADLALVINVIFILGVLAQFGAALTLPGIAGIVLTLGMAVDANVLIYERIREEQRNGLSLREAIHKGFDKAFGTILDANITTFLVGFILYFFGSGPVKGFAITLMIGIATSFFTAVFISRLIIETMARKKDANISFTTALSRNFFANTNFNIVKYRKPAYIFSIAVIAFGFVAMALKGGPNLGVDFRGGRSFVVELNQAVPASDIRSELIGNFENAGTEVKTFGASNRYKIITSYLANDESTQADEKVMAALNQGLEGYRELNPQILSSSKVGATMADDIQKTALLSVVLALIGIFIYVMIRFSKWQFSLGGVIALLHDALMVISFYAIANLFGLSYEMDQVFIAAVLTIIGFSINDTVVIFDRIREFMNDNPRTAFGDLINPALNSTFSRTIITSLTVFFVVLILFIFGGEVLRGFSFALLVGIIFGTYSSLFIATPIVMDTTMRRAPQPVPGQSATAEKVNK